MRWRSPAQADWLARSPSPTCGCGCWCWGRRAVTNITTVDYLQCWVWFANEWVQAVNRMVRPIVLRRSGAVVGRCGPAPGSAAVCRYTQLCKPAPADSTSLHKPSLHCLHNGTAACSAKLFTNFQQVDWCLSGLIELVQSDRCLSRYKLLQTKFSITPNPPQVSSSIFNSFSFFPFKLHSYYPPRLWRKVRRKEVCYEPFLT